MAETLSPNTQKRRSRMAPRLQSPTSPFFLGSNDDNLERAQARAARAAAIRRKTAAAATQPDHDPCLDKQQILDLFHNCIKLASENKINQKNTWGLSLIDHLHDIIKVEEEDDTETNFQKASCTLEAGVKIYSMRVDSVHSEAYKVLGGFNRVGQEDGHVAGDTIGDSNAGGEQDDDNFKKAQERKVSPLSTLESSFEALNVKKFDVAFAVDPLYHQTSSQFDEGGAKGLLLNNLGVYGGCRVLFDSFEVPGKSMSSSIQHDKSGMIDLLFAKEHIEQILLHMHNKDEISPTLKDIVNQFDESSRRLSNIFPSAQKLDEQIHEDHSSSNVELDGNVVEDCGTWAFDHEDQASAIGEDTYTGDISFQSHQEDYEMMVSNEFEMDDRVDKVDGYLFLTLGFKSKQNAWAGPDHWKYQKMKGLNHTKADNGSTLINKKARNKKQGEVDIDFTMALDSEIPDVFAPPKNPNSLLLPANRAPCNTTLPEDCHYQPEDLIKLFLLPIMCLGRKGRMPSGKWSEQKDDYGPLPTWDDENNFGGQYDGDVHSDVEDSNTLVPQPRQVNKVAVQYDKSSKQVDVQSLKATLWDHIQESSQIIVQERKEAISFKHVLANFPEECSAAPALDDISPHLCFICLLHLANEHGLYIHGCTNLDDLSIHLPPN